MNKIIGWMRAHHLGVVAIFLALTGTSYAAGTIGAEDIKRNAVTSKAIAKDSVGPGEIKAKSEGFYMTGVIEDEGGNTTRYARPFGTSPTVDSPGPAQFRFTESVTIHNIEAVTDDTDDTPTESRTLVLHANGEEFECVMTTPNQCGELNGFPVKLFPQSAVWMSVKGQSDPEPANINMTFFATRP